MFNILYKILNSDDQRKRRKVNGNNTLSGTRFKNYCSSLRKFNSFVNISQPRFLMHYLSADCILPVSGEPCYNSVLAIEDNGRIAGIFNNTDLNTLNYDIRHYSGILCPGFVNTHCHLEFSWAKGRINEGEGLDHFVRQLEKIRRSISETIILQAIETEASEMVKSGIVATADISNGNTTLAYKSKSSHYFQTFVEIFGSNPDHAVAVIEKAKGLKAQFETNLHSGSVSVVPHATYSLSDELFRLISDSGKSSLLSIHHQESEEENRFFKDGSGLIKARRKEFNPDIASYPGTGKRPMESIASYFNPDQKILLVHNTVSEQQDIDFIEKYFRHAYWCLCPNANLYIENRLPDIRLLRSNNCIITLGTDSLASNHQLSILEEIKTIQHHFPEMPLNELIQWGTLNGAEFLGIDNKLGSFEKGKNPGVVLIENADIQSMQLKPESTSRLIIPAQI